METTVSVWDTILEAENEEDARKKFENQENVWEEDGTKIKEWVESSENILEIMREKITEKKTDNANIKTFTDLKRLIKKEVDPRLQVRKVKYQSENNNRTCYYYYFYSDDNELSQDLVSLESTSVYVNHWQDQTVNAWLNDATDIMHSIYEKNGKDIMEYKGYKI